MRFDATGEVVDVDDGPPDADLRQPIEAMVDQCPAANFDERFRGRGGERPHALPLAGRQPSEEKAKTVRLP